MLSSNLCILRFTMGCQRSMITHRPINTNAEVLFVRITTFGSLVFLSILVLAPKVAAQADSICSEFGGGFIWGNANVVYGRVEVSGLRDPAKFPKVTVSLVNQGRTIASMPIGRSGNYCFRNTNGSGATVIVAVEESEVGRRDLGSGGSLGSNQFRQDFAIDLGNRTPRAGVISAKYAHKREGKNAELFTAANTLLKEKKTDKAIPVLQQIVETDPKDFVVWALLGSSYFERNDLTAAEAAYLRSLEANPGYAVAITNLGHIYLLQKKLDDAVALLVKATELEPDYARAFQLLGEAYLLSKKGKLGLEALYRAIEIDPIGMAQCHLLAARLFESAGAKNYAAREYKLFLEKVPDYPQKKQLLKYIQDNPPAEN